MNATDTPTPWRHHGPDVGEPPAFADPRRWGSLVGVIGGLVFVDYSSALGPAVATVAWAVAVALALAAVAGHLVRPVALGPFLRLRPLALAVYGACVVGEVALIAVGTDALLDAGRGDLQPALITAVVGLHFLPFSWAFRERMFLVLGGLLVVLGSAALAAGALDVPRAAETGAVLAGLGMLVLSVLYARGRFAPEA